MNTSDKSPPVEALIETEAGLIRLRPPRSERLMVGVIFGFLAGVLAFVIIFTVLGWEMPVVALWPNRRFTERNPLLMGVLAGFLSFLAVGLSVYVSSGGKCKRRFNATIFGTVLAGFLGFCCGFYTVSEFDPIPGQGGVEDRGYTQFQTMNTCKGYLAGLGTSLNCGLFSGASLYLLLDRSDPRDEAGARGFKKKKRS